VFLFKKNDLWSVRLAEICEADRNVDSGSSLPLPASPMRRVASSVQTAPLLLVTERLDDVRLIGVVLDEQVEHPVPRPVATTTRPQRLHQVMDLLGGVTFSHSSSPAHLLSVYIKPYFINKVNTWRSN